MLAIACSLRHLVLCWEAGLLRLHEPCCLRHKTLVAGLLGESRHLLLLELLLLLQALQALARRCLVTSHLGLEGWGSEALLRQARSRGCTLRRWCNHRVACLHLGWGCRTLSHACHL